MIGGGRGDRPVNDRSPRSRSGSRASVRGNDNDPLQLRAQLAAEKQAHQATREEMQELRTKLQTTEASLENSVALLRRASGGGDGAELATKNRELTEKKIELVDLGDLFSEKWCSRTLCKRGVAAEAVFLCKKWEAARRGDRDRQVWEQGGRGQEQEGARRGDRQVWEGGRGQEDNENDGEIVTSGRGVRAVCQV